MMRIEDLKDEFIRDFKTDALIVPSRKKRYASYIIGTICFIVAVTGYSAKSMELFGISAAALGLCIGWYTTKAYRYIQSKEDKQK